MALGAQAEYARRMHEVQAYIDAHIDQNLELPALAAVAHFSAFHFHRLFSAWMGETLGEYLRRRRLELAAQRLIAQPESAVLDIALSVGFGSAEAFARAFKVRFGCTATEWRETQRENRENRNPGQAIRNPDQAVAAVNDDHEGSDHSKENSMKVGLIERQPVRIAYMRYTGPYGQGVSDFWQQQFAPWMMRNNLMGEPRYGIGYDDPAITAPEKCRYDACVEIPADFAVGGGALATPLPGGKYACTSYYGNGADIGVPWRALLRDWLPQSGMQLDNRPFLEYYPRGARYDPQTGAFECELCIPVLPL